MKTSHLVDVSTDAKMADELGSLRAEIKVLQDQAKKIETLMKASGKDVFEGDLYCVTVVHQDRKAIDWKSIAGKLNPSRQLVQAWTKVNEVVSVRVTAHKKEA